MTNFLLYCKLVDGVVAQINDCWLYRSFPDERLWRNVLVSLLTEAALEGGALTRNQSIIQAEIVVDVMTY